MEPQLEIELDTICNSVCSKLTRLSMFDLVEKVRTFQDGGKEIAGYADDYNFKDIKANGYWSLLKIGIRLGHVLNDALDSAKENQFDQSLFHLIDYALIAIDVLKILRKDSLEASTNANNGELSLQASSLSYFVELFGLLLSVDNEKIAAAYGNFCGFWLSSHSRYAAIVFVSALSILSTSPLDGLKCLLNSQYRGLKFAELIKKADIPFVKKLRIMLEFPIYSKVLPRLFHGNTSIRREVYAPRQSHWILSQLNQKVLLYKGRPMFTKKKSVRCVLFQSSPNDNAANKLIIYCHGGGFILGTPESQEIFIRDWTNKLNGIKILSIDYSLAPESKFPVALQEILDVYLWLTSGSKQVIETLGDEPKQIVLVGDSAGGNLITALSLVLNDIRHIDASYSITMPKSLVCFYTPFNITLKLSPSMILASCDSLLSAGFMLSCFEAYLPDFHHPSEYPSTLDFLIPKDFMNLGFVEIVKRWLKMIKDLTSCPQSKPWYREEELKLKQTVENLYKTTSNPYISPLYYHDFESLSNIKLHLIALHFDPFLDDNVAMAKKWKGHVTLDVLDKLQHGFLNFMPFIGEAKEANDLVVKRMLQSFE